MSGTIEPELGGAVIPPVADGIVGCVTLEGNVVPGLRARLAEPTAGSFSGDLAKTAFDTMPASTRAARPTSRHIWVLGMALLLH